jgi:hypothetical protein
MRKAKIELYSAYLKETLSKLIATNPSNYYLLAEKKTIMLQ